MEKVWVIQRSYENIDNDALISETRVYLHKSKEGALAHFEELKPELELWEIDDEEEYDQYCTEGTYVVLTYGGRRNILHLYEEEVLD